MTPVILASAYCAGGGEFLRYPTEAGRIRLEARLQDETVRSNLDAVFSAADASTERFKELKTIWHSITPL